MDYGPSTLEVLPEIVAVVNRKFPVMIDSGFRRGSDVFKALALGADAVALGRAARWGLGAYGAPGVQRLLEVLQAELVHAAAYAGRATLKSIDKTAVKVNFVREDAALKQIVVATIVERPKVARYRSRGWGPATS